LRLVTGFEVFRSFGSDFRYSRILDRISGILRIYSTSAVFSQIFKEFRSGVRGFSDLMSGFTDFGPDFEDFRLDLKDFRPYCEGFHVRYQVQISGILRRVSSFISRILQTLVKFEGLTGILGIACCI